MTAMEVRAMSEVGCLPGCWDDGATIRHLPGCLEVMHGVYELPPQKDQEGSSCHLPEVRCIRLLPTREPTSCSIAQLRGQEATGGSNGAGRPEGADGARPKSETGEGRHGMDGTAGPPRGDDRMKDAPCVQGGVGSDVGRDGRRHIFDCGMVLSGDGPCDSAPPQEEMNLRGDE